MKILYLNNSDVYNMDVIEVLEKRGHSITAISIPDEDYELSKQMLRQEKKNQEEYELTDEYKIKFNNILHFASIFRSEDK